MAHLEVEACGTSAVVAAVASDIHQMAVAVAADTARAYRPRHSHHQHPAETTAVPT